MTTTCKHITQDELKLLLRYEPDTGLFFWLTNKGTAKSGGVAGTPTSNGYTNICVNRKIYKAHRLAWLYVYGTLPSNQVDHMNGVKNDNRIVNLRQATNFENAQNHASLGVHLHKEKNKWQARIRVKDKRLHLGYFESKQDAICAYLSAKEIHHQFQPTPRGFI
jgi:hypothetical protein